jgi:hypothetical protein
LIGRGATRKIPSSRAAEQRDKRAAFEAMASFDHLVGNGEQPRPLSENNSAST